MQLSIIPNIDTQFEDAERVSLLESLPENTVVWIQDETFLKERLLISEEDLQISLELQAGKPKAGADTEEDKLIKKDIDKNEFITAALFLKD